MRKKIALLLVSSAMVPACIDDDGRVLPPEEDVAESVEPVIQGGTDDRKEVYNQSALIRNQAESVVALMSPGWLTDNGDGTSTLTEFLLGSYNPYPQSGSQTICDGAEFGDQPVAASCSGSLVGPDLVLTAAHCLSQQIENGTLAGMRIVFHFRMDDATTPRMTFPNSDIYRIRDIVGYWVNPVDQVLVRLDRVAENRRVAPLRRTSTDAPVGTPLYMIGHPTGLPQKLADNGGVAATSWTWDNQTYYPEKLANSLDTFAGNSGSGVYNADTHEIEAVVSAVATDYQLVLNGTCYMPAPCSQNCSSASKVRNTYDTVPGFSASFFADVNTPVIPGAADLVTIHYSGIDVLLSNGTSGFNAVAGLNEPFYGRQGTFVADVTGDGLADAIAVNTSGITVRPKTSTGFGAVESWSGGFYGRLGTYFGDVDGDGDADAVTITDDGPSVIVSVRRSSGAAFGATEQWYSGTLVGRRGYKLADVTGDGRVDLIALDDGAVRVATSNGNGFVWGQLWSAIGYYGDRGTSFADVDGDGDADAIVVNDDRVVVRRAADTNSDGVPDSFSANEYWTPIPYYGVRGTYFADVTNDGCADAIALTDSSVVVRRSNCTNGFNASEVWRTEASFGTVGVFPSSLP